MALFSGNSSNETFTGVNGEANFFFALSGDDTIFAGDGFNYASMNAGNDRFFAGSGFNIVSGATGTDSFSVQEGTTGFTYINDWRDGEDLFDVSNLGLTDMSEIRVLQFQALTYVIIQGSIFTMAVDDPITADDFIFADTQPSPTVLDFDDLDSPNSYFGGIPDGYGGLNWDANWYFMEVSENEEVFGETGYIANSGDNLAFNGAGEAATFSTTDGSNFDFESFYAHALVDNTEFIVSGYDDGVLVGTQTFTVYEDGTPDFYELDDAIFDSVDEVVIDPVSFNVAFDDFEIIF